MDTTVDLQLPELSVVIPVYNEEQVLPRLFERLYPVLDALGERYEVLFVNDGSRDRSAELLAQQFRRRPDVTRVVLFTGNFGQHMAILAGFEQVRGRIAITLDADLQNPPEEIPRLIAAVRSGHDYVGTIRRQREDSAFRRLASKVLNWLRERTTRIHMTDQGCMLRAYSREIVDAVNRCEEVNTFIPALAYTFARNPTEIEVDHADREAGETKYSLYRLMRLNFDLVTGFSIAPLQVFSILGFVLGTISIGVIVIQVVRRLVIGSAAEGVFDSEIQAAQFFFIGVVLFGIGLLGEYVGRIYQEALRRPRYIIAAVLEQVDDSESELPETSAERTLRRIG